MGEVYKAEDTKLKRIVAIKRVSPRSQGDDSERRRLLREAQQASSLNHPNVAAIYDVFEDADELLLVMEYVDGTPLRAVMHDHKKFTTEEFYRIATQALDGLRAAHEKSILHGDIKPENIMLTPDGRVKVLDFGVARRFSLAEADAATLTSATIGGVSGGTPAYMAPEVLTQKPYDGRADLFSLGLVCYEMLGGQQPFETDSLAGTMASVLHTHPLPLAELNRSVPRPLSTVVQTMLEKDPARRYSTARDVLVDLRRLQQGEDPVFASMSGSSRKEPARRWAAAVLAVIAFILALALWLRPHRAGIPANTSAPGATANQPVTLAVLPFTPRENDPKLTALGEGLVETVSAKLSHLTQDRSFDVIPVQTSQARHANSLTEARAQLGATMALTVTLQATGELLRIDYSLWNTRTGVPVQSDSSTVPAGDAFGAEDLVAQGVAKALQLKLRPEEEAALKMHGTDKPDAYKFYLQSRGYLLDYSKAENVENAILMVQEALKLDPNFGQAKAALGEAYWRKYWLTKSPTWTKLAKAQCETAVSLGNSGPAGHVCLGLVSDGTGQYALAVTEFQRAVELDPTDEDAYIGLALAYEHAGSINEAEKTYQRAIAVRPNSSSACNSLGTFHLRRDEYEKSIAMFQKVIALAPEGYGAYVNLGASYTNMGRYADAIAPLTKSIAIRPSYAAYDNLGTAYIGLEKFSDAAHAYEQAVRLNARQHVTWGNLGDARKYLGDKAGASAAYTEALKLALEDAKINAHDPDALSSIASYYSNLADRQHALLYLQQSLEYGSNDKDVLLDAAAVYNNLGDTGPAVEWLGKAVQAGYAAARINDLPEFRNLRGNPGYEQLVVRAQAQR